MIWEDWHRALRRNTSKYLADLEAFASEFIPWSIAGAYRPQFVLPPSPAEEWIREYAGRVARRMVSGVAVSNARSWAEAARKSLYGSRIYQALRTEMAGPTGVRVAELIQEQTRLISAIPARISERAAAYVGVQARRGLRSTQILEDVRKYLPAVTQSQLRMFARTEVGRAETALTQTRSERLGVLFYQWTTSEDQRVRHSHKAMAHVLVPFAEKPNPELLVGEPSTFGAYAPGGIWNCRCMALPLLDVDEVGWPHRVYHAGHIDYVQRAIFENWIKRAA